MTEKEAKTKWCPFARTVESDVNGVTAPRNRVVRLAAEDADCRLIDHLIGTKCIGSACMAWRWLEKNEPIVTTHGYCGLAGQP